MDQQIKKSKYVIIGGSVAAIGCVEGIRSVDKSGKIVLVSGEKCPAYCRPLISYYLQGKTDLKKMKYRPDEFYSQNNCEVIYAEALKIDSITQTVALDSGRNISYGFLCNATGSSPLVPPFSGLDTVEKKFSFMTQNDMLALEKGLKSDSDVLIIGAGLIGLKCAEGICERVKSVTVCDLAPHILSSILDETSASILQNKLEEYGVKFLLGDSVGKFERNKAIMKSGKKVDFDVLILAVGVRANTALIKTCGGECDRGIIVDTSMKTSVNNIYAAGDCAQGYDASTGENRVIAILPNAYIQGRCAGINMAGGHEIFDCAIPMNAIGFFGLHALTAGSYTGKILEQRSNNTVKRLFVQDERLVGFILIGDVDRSGIYTALIREKMPITEEQALSLLKSPVLAAFSPEIRWKALGGVI